MGKRDYTRFGIKVSFCWISCIAQHPGSLVMKPPTEHYTSRYAVLCVVTFWWQLSRLTPIARFMGPTWGTSGAGRTQVDPMLAPWTLVSGEAETKWLLFCIWTFSNSFSCMKSAVLWFKCHWNVISMVPFISYSTGLATGKTLSEPVMVWFTDVYMQQIEFKTFKRTLTLILSCVSWGSACLYRVKQPCWAYLLNADIECPRKEVIYFHAFLFSILSSLDHINRNFINFRRGLTGDFRFYNDRP